MTLSDPRYDIEPDTTYWPVCVVCEDVIHPDHVFTKLVEVGEDEKEVSLCYFCNLKHERGEISLNQ